MNALSLFKPSMYSFWLLVQKFWTNFMTIVGLKRLNKVILAPILAPSFFKFWKRYSQIFTFFYVRAEHHWKKARARWAAFRTELANTANFYLVFPHFFPNNLVNSIVGFEFIFWLCVWCKKVSWFLFSWPKNIENIIWEQNDVLPDFW